MTILVIDVPAEHSGALTILNQFISEFKRDKDNNYIVVISTPRYEDTSNVSFINFEWVKKSHVHRIYFDKIIVPKLVKRFKPDKLLSLQNNAFNVKGIYQEVYFQNALPIAEKRFSFFESKSLWIYQNLIGRTVKHSLKYADKVIVQAEWIKNALISKWGLKESNVLIKRPDAATFESVKKYCPTALFYPANGSLYKNHLTLIKSLLPLWTEYNAPTLKLTGRKEMLPLECRELLEDKKFPVTFMGRLSKDEIQKEYETNILVFPSYIETVGLPLMEAKIVGAKILAADCAYAREAIGDYSNAEFFHPFDVEQLTSLIRENCKKERIIS